MARGIRPVAVGCVLALRAACAQSVPGPPQFDAASVKLVEPSRGHVDMQSDAGRLDYREFGIKALVWVAYNLPLPQIIWPKGLVGNARFHDISATFPPGTTEEQQHLMLQGLLADRFKLAAHWETRDTKVYALVVSNRGLKIHKAENPPDDSTLSISMRIGTDGFHLNDRLPQAPASAPYGITVSKLVQFFNNGVQLARTMVDKTGLEGYYDINLFIPPEFDAGDPSADLGGRAPAMPSAPTFFDELERQLGLKVETQMAPVETLVIDHLETVPTEN